MSKLKKKTFVRLGLGQYPGTHDLGWVVATDLLKAQSILHNNGTMSSHWQSLYNTVNAFFRLLDL